MLLTLLRRVVKGALHDAVEEWALETGLPLAVVQELRRQRQILAAQIEADADNRAAGALDVEDEEANDSTPALPMHSVARMTVSDVCPSPAAGDGALMSWVRRQREQSVSWAEIAQQTNAVGHATSEDALRMRLRRWKEKQGENGEADSSPVG
jgi:hypothetical protein